MAAHATRVKLSVTGVLAFLKAAASPRPGAPSRHPLSQRSPGAEHSLAHAPCSLLFVSASAVAPLSCPVSTPLRRRLLRLLSSPSTARAGLRHLSLGYVVMPRTPCGGNTSASGFVLLCPSLRLHCWPSRRRSKIIVPLTSVSACDFTSSLLGGFPRLSSSQPCLTAATPSCPSAFPLQAPRGNIHVLHTSTAGAPSSPLPVLLCLFRRSSWFLTSTAGCPTAAARHHPHAARSHSSGIRPLHYHHDIGFTFFAFIISCALPQRRLFSSVCRAPGPVVTSARHPTHHVLPFVYLISAAPSRQLLIAFSRHGNRPPVVPSFPDFAM